MHIPSADLYSYVLFSILLYFLFFLLSFCLLEYSILLVYLSLLDQNSRDILSHAIIFWFTVETSHTVSENINVCAIFLALHFRKRTVGGWTRIQIFPVVHFRYSFRKYKLFPRYFRSYSPAVN